MAAGLIWTEFAAFLASWQCNCARAFQVMLIIIISSTDEKHCINQAMAVPSTEAEGGDSTAPGLHAVHVFLSQQHRPAKLCARSVVGSLAQKACAAACTLPCFLPLQLVALS
jgi:hypothetical protein